MAQSDRPSEDLSISQPFEHVLFDEPNEAPEGGNWRLELVNLAGAPRLVESQSSRAGDGPRTSSRSPALTFVWPHQQCHVSGRLQVRMADRTEAESAPGEITRPPGHDAWWSAMSQLLLSTGRERLSGRGRTPGAGPPMRTEKGFNPQVRIAQ